MPGERILITVTVPPESQDAVLDAISRAGGGVIGSYTHCAFTHAGEGRFMPDADANPYSGIRSQINIEPEIRIETFCPRPQAREVVKAIRGAHPYEEPVIYLIPLLDENDL